MDRERENTISSSFSYNFFINRGAERQKSQIHALAIVKSGLNFSFVHRFEAINHTYYLRGSSNDKKRRKIAHEFCLQLFYFSDYLSVNTELLLITDGRSNDPKKFGFKLEKIKEKFTAIGVEVSAIGVGRINEREIQTEVF